MYVCVCVCVYVCVNNSTELNSANSANVPSCIFLKTNIIINSYKKKSVSAQQLGNWFPTLSAVRAQQINKNGKFSFFVRRRNCDNTKCRLKPNHEKPREVRSSFWKTFFGNRCAIFMRLLIFNIVYFRLILIYYSLSCLQYLFT